MCLVRREFIFLYYYFMVPVYTIYGGDQIGSTASELKAYIKQYLKYIQTLYGKVEPQRYTTLMDFYFTP